MVVYDFDLFATHGPCLDCAEAPAEENVHGLCGDCLPNYYLPR